MKKLLLIITLVIALTHTIKSQQTEMYCNFDGTKVVNFGWKTGTMDSIIANPQMNPVDSSWYCAKYTRSDTAQYDLFELYPTTKLRDISNFESGAMAAPKITMKVYTTAPVGSPISLQLGARNIPAYPDGIRSEFIAYTTAQNAWQNLTFNFSQVTPGGTVAANNIDKLVFLLRPGTYTSDIIYFDELKGPALSPVGINVTEKGSFKLFQNSPNPVKDNTHIDFVLSSPGQVSVKIYDMLGNSVSSVVEQNLKAGSYSFPVNTENIPNGIYFYVLKKEGVSRSMKMIVSK